jgi:hypothetical protein
VRALVGALEGVRRGVVRVVRVGLRGPQAASASERQRGDDRSEDDPDAQHRAEP